MHKKAITYNIVTLIILVLVILISAALFTRMYHAVTDSGTRNLCNLEGTKGQIQSLKPIGFWKTYEINCKAEKEYITTSQLVNSPISTSQLAASEFSDKKANQLTDAEKIDLQLKSKFANKLEDCWKMTGDRDVFIWDEMKFNSDSEYESSQNTFLLENGITSESTTTISVGPKAPLVTRDTKYSSACVVCSTTFFETSLQSVSTRNLEKVLQNTPYNDKVSWWAEITREKNNGPKQIFDTSKTQSVVYYQLKDSALSTNAKRLVQNTGVVIIPTEKIPLLCDVVANQI